MKKKLVSIVAPVYNEEKTIKEFIARLMSSTKPLSTQYNFQFILVDDGSTDASVAVMKQILNTENRMEIVELRKNYGQTSALQAGLDHAEGEIIISLDSDLQHFPEEIPKFLEKIEEGYDIVCGWRHKRQEGIIRRWPSKIANHLIRSISGLVIHDIGTTFRAYRAEIIRDIRLLGENHRFVPVFAKKAGARITELPIQNIERPQGKSNYGISRTLNVFFDLFFLHFYMKYFDRPIRIFAKLALFLFTFFGLIWMLLFLLSLTKGISGVVRAHSGWFILSMILLLSSLQLLMTGIIAEVLARLYYSGGTSHSRNSTYRVRTVWKKESLIKKIIR